MADESSKGQIPILAETKSFFLHATPPRQEDLHSKLVRRENMMTSFRISKRTSINKCGRIATPITYGPIPTWFPSTPHYTTTISNLQLVRPREHHEFFQDLKTQDNPKLWWNRRPVQKPPKSCSSHVDRPRETRRPLDLHGFFRDPKAQDNPKVW